MSREHGHLAAGGLFRWNCSPSTCISARVRAGDNVEMVLVRDGHVLVSDF